MKIGVVITAKNEERLIRDNLRYHRFLGVDKVYLYLDQSSDGTRQRVSDLSFVETNLSVDGNKFTGKPGLVLFIANQEEHHTARQCLNAFDALQKSKQDGLDWLISIDADELLIVDKFKAEKDQLKIFFDNLPADTHAVQFRVYEAMQRKFKYENVFKEETLFKSGWKFEKKLDELYKKIYDPFLCKSVIVSFWYGQGQGKMAIRTSMDWIPKNVHRFQRADGQSHNVCKSDGLLHYHAYDFEDFIKKFKNFANQPDTWVSGNDIDYLRRLWRDIVNKSNWEAQGLEQYYANSVMFDDQWIRTAQKRAHFGIIPRRQKGIEEISCASRVFEWLEKMPIR